MERIVCVILNSSLSGALNVSRWLRCATVILQEYELLCSVLSEVDKVIYSQIEVEPRSNITLVLKMAGLAILRREFFYSIKEEMEMNYEKYKRFETIKLKDRTWPDKTIEKAPICRWYPLIFYEFSTFIDHFTF